MYGLSPVVTSEGPSEAVSGLLVDVDIVKCRDVMVDQCLLYTSCSIDGLPL